MELFDLRDILNRKDPNQGFKLWGIKNCGCSGHTQKFLRVVQESIFFIKHFRIMAYTQV